MAKNFNLLKIIEVLVLCWFLLSGCGAETARPNASPYVPPTAPPTPANFENVPDAATAAARRTAVPLAAKPSSGPTATPALATLPEDNPENRGVESAPDKADPTTLAKLLGSPGPGSLPGGASIPLTASSGNNPGKAAPTATLNTGPGQTKIEALRNGKVSFLGAYRQAIGRVQPIQSDVRLAFASANILKPERVVWSFLFVTPDGERMWKVIFDSTGPKLDMIEQAPTMLTDAMTIDMNRVLDGDELLRRAEQVGLKLSWPVDIFNFQVEGNTRQPCFIMTNVSQGKQVAINAYTGAVVRDDFVK
jgi:hypothetical protein